MAPQPAVKTPRGKPPRDKREAAIKYNERRNFRRRMARVESDNRRAAAMEAAKVDHITSAKPRTPPVHMGRDYWKNKSKHLESKLKDKHVFPIMCDGCIEKGVSECFRERGGKKRKCMLCGNKACSHHIRKSQM